MSVALPGFSSPAVGFEVPLEMLAACHGRVQAQCDTLRRLRDHMDRHGVDRAAQEAAAAVMRYFDTAARHHHADEEQDLFPALRAAVAHSDPGLVVGLVESLMAEHRQLEAAWAALRPELERLVVGQATRLTGLMAFVEAYERHVERENAELLPLAERLLDADTLERVGRAMRERRTGTGPDQA